MTTSRRPVVVGVLDKQPHALRFALREAVRAGTSLRVVHSAGLPTQAVEFYISADVYADVHRAGEEILDDARHLVAEEPSAPEVTYVLATTPPVVALEHEAEGAALLVVGADDSGWFERLLGSDVTAHVARHVACPVVVVPERDYPGSGTGDVVAAIDGDTSATAVLRFAFDQADRRGGVLRVLHATPPGTLRADAEAIRANIGEVLAGWGESYPDVRVLTSLTIDDVEGACAKAAQDADLVVVGRPHARSASFALARPLAAQILRRASCPVAVVPVDHDPGWATGVPRG